MTFLGKTFDPSDHTMLPHTLFRQGPWPSSDGSGEILWVESGEHVQVSCPFRKEPDDSFSPPIFQDWCSQRFCCWGPAPHPCTLLSPPPGACSSGPLGSDLELGSLEQRAGAALAPAGLWTLCSSRRVGEARRGLPGLLPVTSGRLRPESWRSGGRRG